MAKNPLDKKLKVSEGKEERLVENHMQMFIRLSNPIFNQGAMHGTPGMKKQRGG